MRPFMCKTKGADEPWTKLTRVKSRGYLQSTSLNCGEMMEIGVVGASLLPTRACIGEGQLFSRPIVFPT
jgi:hypothetical protein